MPKTITSTLVVLIPKVNGPQDFDQFRPIDLCIFVDKVILNILAVILLKVLSDIISYQQSDFVKGQQISNNFLLA